MGKKFVAVLVTSCLLTSLIFIVYTDMIAKADDPEFFTIIVIPDTQKIVDGGDPDDFTELTQWIVDNKDTYNIEFVAHVGDIVDNAVTSQWEDANTSLSILFDDDIPFLISVGNHDYDDMCANCPKQTDDYNEYFPYTRFWELFNNTDNGSWGGCFESDSSNMYAFFDVTIGGTLYEFIAIALEFCPSSESLAWVNSTLNTYSDKHAFLFTHSYVDVADDFDYDCRSGRGCCDCGTSCNEAQTVWDIMVKYHDNIFMVASGHHMSDSEVYGAQGYVNGSIPLAYRDDLTSPFVHQIMANYQQDGAFGDAVIRIYKFYPGSGLINVTTFEVAPGSTWHTDNQNEMDLFYDFTKDDDPSYPSFPSFQSINGQLNNTVLHVQNRTFVWNIVEDATIYGLRVSNYSDFHDEIFLQLDDINEINYGVNYTEASGNVSFILPDVYNITFDGYHYYQVRAYTT